MSEVGESRHQVAHWRATALHAHQTGGVSHLGEFVAIIDQILRDDESAPKKQRHHARRIYERLKCEHGYSGSYYPIRRYVASLRQGNRETFMRIDHVPGRRMEFDFGQVWVDYPHGRKKTDVLSGVWTYSNCPFLIALPNQRTESILQGMKSAFEFFICIPREVWWDNPRAVAIEILRGRDRTLNPAYASLASHYRFDPLFCMPAKGQEKSDVEQSVFALERRACTPVPRAEDFADLNRQLLAFCLAERDRTVAHQSLTIGQNFELEKAAAMPLPAHPFDACIKRSGQVDKYQTVRFGQAACRAGKRVKFYTAQTLVNQLEEAQKHYRLERMLAMLSKIELLLVDELGYISFSRSGAELLFQVFADRYERGSILITSNLPFGEWGSIFQGDRMTAALLDRLTHRCTIFEMNGESYRFQESVKTAKPAKEKKQQET